MSKIPTPEYNIDDIIKSSVYEPSEDTFLLLDALEADLGNLQDLNPAILLEVGSGSGVVITALAKLLGGRTHCLAVDISTNACAVTQRTAVANGVKVQVVRSDLLNNLRQDHLIDVLVFNPPYVVTSSEEMLKEEVISKAYSGGHRGREVMDRLFPVLLQSLSERCIFYLLLLKENDPEDIMGVLAQYGFSGETLISRQVPGEKLFVLKFTRNLNPCG